MNLSTTWVTGSSGLDSTLTIGPPLTPGARNYHCAAMSISGPNTLYTFGGEGYGSTTTLVQLSTFWAYDIRSAVWTILTDGAMVSGTKGIPASLNRPGPLAQQECAISPYDGKFYMFAGTPDGTARFNNLWRYDFSSGMWTWVSGDSTRPSGYSVGIDVADPTNIPSVRTDPAFTAHYSKGILVLVGGFGLWVGGSTASYLNDVWTFDIATGNWKWISGSINLRNQFGVFGTKGVASTANIPGSRLEGSIQFERVTGSLLLFAGYGFTGGSVDYLNDLWRLNMTSKAWAWIGGTNTGNSLPVSTVNGEFGVANYPGGRGGCSFTYIANFDLYGVFGGYGSGSQSTFLTVTFFSRFITCSSL